MIGSQHNAERLLEKLQVEDVEQTGHLDEYSLKEGFTAAEIELNEFLLEWLVCYLFNYSQDLAQLPYYKMFIDLGYKNKKDF